MTMITPILGVYLRFVFNGEIFIVYHDRDWIYESENLDDCIDWAYRYVRCLTR
jgi:hypothetical protein